MKNNNQFTSINDALRGMRPGTGRPTDQCLILPESGEGTPVSIKMHSRVVGLNKHLSQKDLKAGKGGAIKCQSDGKGNVRVWVTRSFANSPVREDIEFSLAQDAMPKGETRGRKAGSVNAAKAPSKASKASKGKAPAKASKTPSKGKAGKVASKTSKAAPKASKAKVTSKAKAKTVKAAKLSIPASVE